MQYSESRNNDNEIKKVSHLLRTNVDNKYPERNEMILKRKISELGNSSDYFKYKATTGRKEEAKAIVILEKKYKVKSVIRNTTAVRII